MFKEAFIKKQRIILTLSSMFILYMLLLSTCSYTFDECLNWHDLKEYQSTVEAQNFINYTEIDDWVDTQITYKSDPSGGEYAFPVDSLRRGTGDCDDYALTTIAIGYRVLDEKWDYVSIFLLKSNQDHAVVKTEDGIQYTGDYIVNKVVPFDEIDTMIFFQ